MSIIQQNTTASLSDNWRTINIDALDPESSLNFDLASLYPAGNDTQISESDVRSLAGQVRQLLRGGDAEGALRGACEGAPVGNEPETVKELHLQTVTEVLQSIKASEMTPMLQRIYGSEGGSDVLDILVKYLYKGMASSNSSSISHAQPPARGARGSVLTPQSTGFSQMSGRPGAANESSGAAMSVLLSWHEKVVEVAGAGCIARCMSDRRRV